MSDKIKITKKEIEDLYDIEEQVPGPKEELVETEETKNFTFEEFTEHYDKNDKRLEIGSEE